MCCDVACQTGEEEFLWKLDICSICGFGDTATLHQNASGSGNV